MLYTDLAGDAAPMLTDTFDRPALFIAGAPSWDGMHH
jgi:hypothetical protein